VREIAKVRGEDVDIDARTLKVVGKGGRTDSIPLHNPLVAAAATMLTAAGGFLPMRRSGEHLRQERVRHHLAGDEPAGLHGDYPPAM
jgi:integrase/recombinase XerD